MKTHLVKQSRKLETCGQWLFKANSLFLYHIQLATVNATPPPPFQPPNVSQSTKNKGHSQIQLRYQQ